MKFQLFPTASYNELAILSVNNVMQNKINVTIQIITIQFNDSSR